MRWLPLKKRQRTSTADGELLTLTHDVLQYLSHVLASQHLPLQVWYEVEHLARRCEEWWRRTRDVSAAGLVGLWEALHDLHWALQHGFCGPQRCSFGTRHPPPYSHRFCLSPADETLSVIPEFVVTYGFWQEADIIVRLFQATLLQWPRCTVLDVGANVGAVALLLAKAGPRVVAVEPEASNFAALSRGAGQLAAEGWPGVRAVHAAAGDVAGSVRLRYLGGDGARTMVDWGDAGGVRSETLDAIAAREPGPLCGLKVDAEGSDYRVLRGAPRVLAQVCAVVVEFDPSSLQAQGVASPKAFTSLLAGFFLYYVIMVSERGALPVQVGLRRIGPGDPCTAESWGDFDRGLWTQKGSRMILATRHLFLERGGGLPWVRLEPLDEAANGSKASSPADTL